MEWPPLHTIKPAKTVLKCVCIHDVHSLPAPPKGLLAPVDRAGARERGLLKASSPKPRDRLDDGDENRFGLKGCGCFRSAILAVWERDYHVVR